MKGLACLPQVTPNREPLRVFAGMFTLEDEFTVPVRRLHCASKSTAHGAAADYCFLLPVSAGGPGWPGPERRPWPWLLIPDRPSGCPTVSVRAHLVHRHDDVHGPLVTVRQMCIHVRRTRADRSETARPSACPALWWP